MTSAQHHTLPNGADAADEQQAPNLSAGAYAAPAGAGPSVAELEDRWRRAVAELDNLRKRFERQMTEQARAERAKTVAALLPVLDNLELALRHAEADPAAIVPGVRAVHAQGLDVLGGLGYQRIDTIGVRFDPARHEASGSAPAGDSVAPGTVVEVHRAGYADADGALVRPAVVTVAQAAESPAGQEADERQTTVQDR